MPPMASQRTGAPSAAAPPAPALPVLGGKKSSYRERVADALRAALIAGELRPGEVHSAPALAARFGVSATPVREAMLDLAKEGLVDTVPNKGFRVTAVTEKQLDEYTHVRSLIEIPTTVGLARTADPVSLEALRPPPGRSSPPRLPATSSRTSRPTPASISVCWLSRATRTSSRWSVTCANAPASTA